MAAATIICELLEKRLGTPKKAYSVSIDGTSATCKTTIVQTTAKYANVKSNKVSKEYPIKNTNTMGGAMLGYAMCGVKMMNRSRIVMDRSPLNCYEWYVLWTMMNEFNAKFGNVEYNERNSDHAEMIRRFKTYFEDMLKYEPYMKIRNLFVGYSIIDSDWKAVDARRTRRGTGSDVHRSTFQIYSFMQNLMYECLYPDRCIDLNDYRSMNYELKEIVEGIAMYIALSFKGDAKPRMNVDEIKYRYPLNPSDNWGRFVKADAERTLIRVESKYQKQFNNPNLDIPKTREEIFKEFSVLGIGYDISYTHVPLDLEIDQNPSKILNLRDCDANKIINFTIEPGTDKIGPIIHEPIDETFEEIMDDEDFE